MLFPHLPNSENNWRISISAYPFYQRQTGKENILFTEKFSFYVLIIAKLSHFDNCSSVISTGSCCRSLIHVGQYKKKRYIIRELEQKLDHFWILLAHHSAKIAWLHPFIILSPIPADFLSTDAIFCPHRSNILHCELCGSQFFTIYTDKIQHKINFYWNFT